MTTAPATLPFLLAELEAITVERISPTFVRVAFGSPALADFGTPGPRYDQRIKLVFPARGKPLPDIADVDETWMTTWFEQPEEERGAMRTYTICDVQGEGAQTRFVVDIVVHEDGKAGPGATWALNAKPGDRVITLAPRRDVEFGGIEYVPPADTDTLLLVGDETALPAISSILDHLDDDARGVAFVEVPEAADFRDLCAPPGVEVRWLARGHHEPGARLVPAVRELFGLEPGEWADPTEVDPDLWETPTYSSSGVDVEAEAPAAHPGADPAGVDRLYAWIAGESLMVTTLRRALVTELGVDRKRVCFMGYWRRGVAMRS
jgi:NADPH-dependent ferric siderophore reductase